MTLNPVTMSAVEVAGAVARGAMTATQSIEASLVRISAANPALNAFTAVTAERARRRAGEIDAGIARGESQGPLPARSSR